MPIDIDASQEEISATLRIHEMLLNDENDITFEETKFDEFLIKKKSTSASEYCCNHNTPPSSSSHRPSTASILKVPSISHFKFLSPEQKVETRIDRD